MQTNSQPDDPQRVPEYVKVQSRTRGMSLKAYQEKGERENAHKKQLWETLLTPRKLVCVVEAKLLFAIETEGSVDSESNESVAAFLQKVLNLAGIQCGTQIDESFEAVEVKVYGTLNGNDAAPGTNFGTIKDGQYYRRTGHKQATFFLDGGD